MKVSLLVFVFLSLSAHATERPLNCQSELTKPVGTELSVEGGYLHLALAPEPAAKLRTELEKRLRMALKNRGEAHVTVLAPHELDILKQALGEKEVIRIAAKAVAGELKVDPICVGMAQVAQDKTYFVAVNAPFFMRVRKALADELKVKKYAGEEFKAEALDPHITLGFTDHDLHGIHKDKSTCAFAITVP